MLPKVTIERAPPRALRKQVMSPTQEARARLQLKARNRRLMSPPILADLIRRQLNGREHMASTEFAVDSIENVRAFQSLCTVSAAVGSNSAQLKANARLTVNKFKILRTGVDAVQGEISHVAFDIATPKEGKK
ncbi:MAG: hypothetical protein RSE34_00945 [Brevundimonas sp.]